MTTEPKKLPIQREVAYVWRGGRRRFFKFKNAVRSYAWLRVREKHKDECNCGDENHSCDIHVGFGGSKYHEIQRRYVRWLLRVMRPPRVPKLEQPAAQLVPVRQPELFEPLHESLQVPRLQWGHAERIYAEHWQALNERSPGLNRGYTYLEHILCPSGQEYPGPITQRDATVAACVIQWLGTNCGMSFIAQAERRIDSERERGLAEPRHVHPIKFHHANEFKPARPKYKSTRQYTTNDY